MLWKSDTSSGSWLTNKTWENLILVSDVNWKTIILQFLKLIFFSRFGGGGDPFGVTLAEVTIICLVGMDQYRGPGNGNRKLDFDLDCSWFLLKIHNRGKHSDNGTFFFSRKSSRSGQWLFAMSDLNRNIQYIISSVKHASFKRGMPWTCLAYGWFLQIHVLEAKKMQVLPRAIIYPVVQINIYYLVAYLFLYWLINT